MAKRLDLTLEEMQEILALFERQTVAVDEDKLDKKLKLLRKIKQAEKDEREGKPT